MGHYLGLAHLGREAMASHRLGVCATDTMAGFLRGNAPWSLLIEHGHIVLHAVRPGVSFPLGDRLEVEAITVPHRDELSDTVAYRIQGPERSLLYCPDIDSWSAWGDRLPTLLDEVDIAFLDATFYSRNELPGRDLSAIAHPLVVDTVPRVEGARAEVVLVHLNHTNPLLVEGPERSWIAARGVDVGREGAAWSLG
jgi:pyrroloquinoline quinone biosynthesis protein B